MAGIVQVLGDGRPGGGTTLVLTLSRRLAELGEEVIILTQSDSSLGAAARQSGLNVVGLDFSRRRSAPVLATQVARVLRRCNPAVVHAHGARAGLPIAMVPHGLTGRLVYTVHGFHFPHKPPVAAALASLAEKFCIARADCTVFVSDADRALAERAGLLRRARAHQIIPNAVTLDDLRFADHQLYDIGFLGRLHPQKNPLILIDLLKAMRPARPRLCVIGGGELADRLAARAAEEGLSQQVRLCGECARDEALETLSACRVLVLPSLWEGHPLALIEAMHLGIPAVASDIPGNRDVIVDGETGFLVAPKDTAAYADRLRRLLADDALRACMAASARRRAASSQYAFGRVLNAYREVYGAASARSGGSIEAMRA